MGLDAAAGERQVGRDAAVRAAQHRRLPAIAQYERELGDATRVGTLTGADLVGRTYTPLFPYFADQPNAFRVLEGDFVSTEDGTGVVHLALDVADRPGRLNVATVNGPGATVVAGDVAALDELEACYEAAGVRARRIPVDYASHSPHVEAVRDEMFATRTSLRHVDANPGRWPTDGMTTAPSAGCVTETGVTGVTRLIETGNDFDVLDAFAFAFAEMPVEP